MAARFGGPVSDTAEVSLRAGAILDNTKATTEWSIRVWNKWAVSRSTANCWCSWNSSIDNTAARNTPCGSSLLDG